MAVKQMKETLKRAYPDKKWAEKVDKMTPSEVSQMIIRLKGQGKI